MDRSWKHVREAMQGESRLVREDPLLTGPQPEDDEFLVFPRREAHETVDPSPDPEQACTLEPFTLRPAGEIAWIR